MDVYNYVGLLQEKCSKMKTSTPHYYENDSDSKSFKFTCTLGEYTTEGIGISKKVAKQNAAKSMISKLESEGVPSLLGEASVSSITNNAVSKLFQYCSKEKKGKPSFSEERVDGLVVMKCSFDGYIGVGKGLCKKEAKEKSADEVLNHFDIHSYFENLIKNEPKLNSVKINNSSVSKLFEYCAKEKKVKPLFSEKPEEDGLIIMECSFDGYIGVGRGLHKKEAKEKSAEEVLNHFDIHSYLGNSKKTEPILNSVKDPVSELNQLCSVKKLKNALYREEIISTAGYNQAFVVICTVEDNQATSSPKAYKKDAKKEAARLMIDILENYTPISSPFERSVPCEESEDTVSPAKRPCHKDEDEDPCNKDEDMTSQAKKLKK